MDAVDDPTGRRCGPSFGDPETEWLPIDRLMPSRAPLVLEFRVHRGTDEPVILAGAIRCVKGSCTYRPEP